MKQTIKRYIHKISEDIAKRTGPNTEVSISLEDSIAYRIVSETIMNNAAETKKPNEVFSAVSDDCWFWLNTEGVRRNQKLRDYLPRLADEHTQQLFTGDKGDATLKEGYLYYKIFKEQFEKHRGSLSSAQKILDFGCGWGRIIRFFLKDLDPEKIWGCDPVEEMIELCKSQNHWCNFQHINTNPPTNFADNSFDLIYSFSVFSHLSEDFHLSLLPEIKRILRPGGIYMTTTRTRKFILDVAELRKEADLAKMHEGPRSSTEAFTDTNKALSDFDNGLYTHHNFNQKEWPYWGETAIPKKYVQDKWTEHFTFLDFLELTAQNVIIVQKPF